MSRIGKLLGVAWGEEAGQVVARLGIACKGWYEWSGGQGFEVCNNLDSTLSVLGRDAQASLIRTESELHGLELAFVDCASEWAQLREAVRDKLDLVESDTKDLYQICLDGEVVHFMPSGNGCTLVLASPRFGKAYSSYLLGKGFRDLAASMMPH
jgi:hypothetical protein